MTLTGWVRGALAGVTTGPAVAGAMALSILLMAPAAFAQTPKAGQKTTPAAAPAAAAEPSAWAVTCANRAQNQFNCEMTQNIVDQASGGQVLLISIKPASSGGSNAMLIRALHGIYLPAGITVHIDNGQVQKLEFQKSDRFGVYAALPLNDKIVAEMRTGRELHLAMQVNKDQPLAIVARLTGFGPAYEKVNSIK